MCCVLVERNWTIVDAALDGIKLPKLFDDSPMFKNLELLDFLEECTYEAMLICVTRLLLWFVCPPIEPLKTLVLRNEQCGIVVENWAFSSSSWLSLAVVEALNCDYPSL
jgi:hypothetical protein